MSKAEFYHFNGNVTSAEWRTRLRWASAGSRVKHLRFLDFLGSCIPYSLGREILNEMDLEKSLAVLNEMQSAGVIGEYAIGGAVAAFLYLEPGTTFDLDVFILWEAAPSGLLDFTPIYDFMSEKGYVPQREGIMIEGWEVLFLPASTPLEKEALVEARSMEIGGIPTRIFTPEHLMAISLQTGRAKDFARLVQFVQEGQPDEKRFEQIVDRYDLRRKWEDFRKRFLEA